MIRAWFRRATVLTTLVCLGPIVNWIPLQANLPGGLVFEVLPVQGKIPLGKPIYLRFQLRNTGTENALVDRRFYLNDIVSLEIIGPSGQSVSWCGRIPQIEVSRGDFVFLAPGAHVEKIVRVSCNERKTSGYAFSGPGQYVIKAQYQLPFPKEVLSKAARGATIAKGPIPAHPIQITIVDGWRAR
jgi:hypothetical protein